MSKNRTLTTKMLVFALAVLFLVTGSGITSANISASAVVESVNGSESLVRTSLAEIKSVLTSVAYSAYLESFTNPEGQSYLPYATDEIAIDLFNFVSDSTNATVKKADASVYKNGEAYDVTGDILLVGDDGKVTFNVNVANGGLYAIRIEYWTGNAEYEENGETLFRGKSTNIERMIMIDGEVPFKEARSIRLARTWVDSYYQLDEEFKIIRDELGNKLTYTTLDEKFKNAAADQTGAIRIFQEDNGGNEMKPVKTLYPQWVTTTLHDSSGYSTNSLCFGLTEGTHTIALATVREPIAIKSITLVPADKEMSYEEYLEYYKNQGVTDYSGDETAKIQAEYVTMTSDKTIYQLNDRTSAITEPQHVSLQRLNSIGGDKWTYCGQWIEYEVTVPEDGMYNIVARYLQSTVEGMYVSRKVYINGEVPFDEASDCRYNFNDEWQVAGLYDGKAKLPDGEKAFKFYLKKGVNKIRLEVALGDMADILSDVETTLTNANAYYRKILMLTGPDPDEYRDYQFDKIMPDVLKGLKAAAEQLYDVSERLTAVTGVRGSNNGTLERVALVLEKMGKYPGKIAPTLSTMKDYLAALGSWLTSSQSQPLTLDYIVVQSPSKKLPKAEAGFFETIWDEIKKFFVSFFADYNSISSTSELTEEQLKDLESASIEVWTTSSREQAQIIKRLVDDDFTQQYNIPVKVSLVVGGTLLPATLAGTGPDVAMNIDQSTPINYAIRSAVLALNSTEGGYDFTTFDAYRDNSAYTQIFADDDERRANGEEPLVATFDEVFERFADAAKVPITLYGKTYAVPDSMSFSMMFYRKDVFVEMGLNVPNTWDDFKTCISTLQASHLNIGFPSGVGGSTILMYQQGETYFDEGNYKYYLENYPELFGYDEATGEYTKNVYTGTYTDEEGNKVTGTLPETDGMTINLDSNIALASFKRVCQYFTNYDFPVSYTLADRFRDGSMPLAVADYASTYNTLIIFAPEIAGLWEFTPLPGTLQEDGKTIDNTTVASISTIVLMRTVKPENAFTAWLFMQWWTSAEIQSAYANEMEALLGPSAKQASANIEALSLMAWSRDELDNLMAQFKAIRCTPEYPGSYIIGRYTNFAFLDVYNKGENPVTELLSYIVNINNELSRKRKEFGLLTQEDFNKNVSGN